MNAPPISIVIATRNRASVLRDTLAAIRRLRWPVDRLEVIVADNGSTDDTPVVVREWASAADGLAVHYLFVSPPGKSVAVNAALADVRGDIVVFTDDDVWPEAEWLAAIARALDETGADFLAGRILPTWGVPPPAWMSPSLYGVLAVPDNGDVRRTLSADGGIMPIGANMAVRRSALEQVGGLCESLGKLEGSLRTGEDHEFFLRLLAHGCHGIYEPTAVVHHLVPADRLRETYFHRWLYQNGRDVACLRQLYPSTVRTLAGVPRYRWREAAGHAWQLLRATVTGDARTRVASTAQLAWLTGYVREVWRGQPAVVVRPPLDRTRTVEAR